MSLLAQLLDAIDEYDRCGEQFKNIPDRYEDESKYALNAAVDAKRRLFDLRDEARKLGPL